MAGMKFEYDESGSTFYYFLLAFYALVLLPMTYYFWPTSQSDRIEQGKRKCHCDGCQMKRHLLKSFSPWKERKKKLLKLLFFVLWIILAVLLYKVNTIKVEWMDFDPYNVLGIDRGASPMDIRRAYRQLSLTHHPDKGGDPQVFQQISKAYRALTNEQDRKNWEIHGSPDGPTAINFGIALPKWLVRQENSMLVLGVYGLVFMVLLPVVVGTWWYRTIKFTGESILLQTTEIFRYFLMRTPNMSFRRILMILASACEFNRLQNPEVVERPSDNEEVPMVMKQLPQVNEKNKEPPFCLPYALKARVLLHAHLSRLDLNPNTLEVDRRTVVCKCPALLQEMVSLSMQLVACAQYYGSRCGHPRLETIECIMKLSPMIVQGLWENKSPILQLPHISEDSLRHFVTRKRNIRTIRQLALMPDSERRALLRSLTEDQYRDVMTVCAGMPQVDVQSKIEVIDDDKPEQVTASSLVTVTVTLTRRDLAELMSATSAQQQQQQQQQQKQSAAASANDEAGRNTENDEDDDLPPLVEMSVDGDAQQQPAAEAPDEDADEADGAGASRDGDESDGESGWDRVQEQLRRDNSLDTRSRTTRVVHCPMFPGEKLEFWWLYICDKRVSKLLTQPVFITSLDDTEQVPLRFQAPDKPGSYTYTLCLRSDSYLDLELNLPIRLDVLPAAEVPVKKPVYDSSDQDDADSDYDDESDIDARQRRGGGGARPGADDSDGGSTEYDYSE
uniref:J domain-containing protein n=1 Tax=Macrostomum lignano TaxID=282301 RepID=A0A1I8GJ51_9PLAT